jgi:hypothetical protein
VTQETFLAHEVRQYEAYTHQFDLCERDFVAYQARYNQFLDNPASFMTIPYEERVHFLSLLKDLEDRLYQYKDDHHVFPDAQDMFVCVQDMYRVIFPTLSHFAA